MLSDGRGGNASPNWAGIHNAVAVLPVGKGPGMLAPRTKKAKFFKVQYNIPVHLLRTKP